MEDTAEIKLFGIANVERTPRISLNKEYFYL